MGVGIFLPSYTFLHTSCLWCRSVDVTTHAHTRAHILILIHTMYAHMHIYNACTHILIQLVRMCLASPPLPLPSPFVSGPTPRIISMPFLTCYVMDLSHHTSHSSHRNACIHRIHIMVSHHIHHIASHHIHHIASISSHHIHHITPLTLLVNLLTCHVHFYNIFFCIF